MAHVRPPLRSADLRPRRTWYVGAVAAADTKSNVGATRCAERVRQLGGESPPPNLMEVKG